MTPLVTLLIAMALAGPAAAAPSEPTLTLAELQTRIEAGPVTGYFLTVDQGSHIASVPMTVLSIVGGAGPDGALIMFQADMADPLMQRIGTIASGMSGSPLFVTDPGGDLLIGALSYGDIFTLGGLALATPIEYMSAVEARLGASAAAPSSAPRTVQLRSPVRVPGDGLVSRVAVVADRDAAKAVREPGVAVFAPLASVQIGGLPVTSGAYRALAAELERRGHTVARGLGSGPGGWDPGFTAPLTGGAALAAMYTRGDLWAGGLGTVTYVAGDRLVAFGHPMDWAGPTSLYLCNAQIDGIWADSMAAYKLGTPGAVRGAITQDRGSAIAGPIGDGPAEVPVTSSVTADMDGGTTVTGATWITSHWAEDPFGAFLASVATSVPAYRAADRAFMPGSAHTTTTVVVSDGATEYTVRRENLWDDGFDVLWVMSDDVFAIVDALTADPYGIAPATILSVDSQATLSDSRLAAGIADVAVAGGLHYGANTVTVTLNAYGLTAPVTIDVPLLLSPGSPLDGILVVAPAAQPRGDEEEPGEGGVEPRQTVAEIVDSLNAAPRNDELEVTFVPDAAPWGPDPTGGGASVSSTAATGYVVSGSVGKPTPMLSIRARPARVYRHHRTTLSGEFFAADGETSVRIYRRYRGESTWVRVATRPVSVVDGLGSFTHRTSRLKKAAVFKVVWDGDESTLAATARVVVNLRT
jgi:hypothetical protein